MTTNAQTLTGLYAKHSGVIRAGLFTLIMMGILAWILIGDSVSAQAATLHAYSAAPQGVIDPVQPDGSALGVFGAIVGRLFAVLLFIITSLAIAVALVLTVRWLILLGTKNERATSAAPLKGILICLGIAGVLGSTGTAIYLETAKVLGGVIFL